MARKKKTQVVKKSKRAYDYDDKIAILRWFDEHNMSVDLTCKEFGIARSTVFKWKNEYWDDMKYAVESGVVTKQQVKEKQEVAGILPAAEIKKIDHVKRKAVTTVEKALDIILFKLEREKAFMEIDDTQMGKIRIQELSKLIEITLGYFVPKAVTEPEGMNTTMEQKYSRVTQYIQNNFLQQKNIENGRSKENPAAGNGRLVTILPGNDGAGDGDSESTVQKQGVETGAGEGP